MQDQCYYRCLPVNGETNIIYILRDSGVTETNPKQTSSCLKSLNAYYAFYRSNWSGSEKSGW